VRVSSRTTIAIACCLLGALPSPAKVLLSVDEALALAFPGAEMERRTVYLTAGQRDEAAGLAGVPLATGIVHPYLARRDGEVVGTAFFDTHLVRTLAATVMVAVDARGQVLRVETIAFDEPPDYLPRSEWFRQFDGHRLDPELELRRAIRPVTGATLTARSTTDAVRRALALERVLRQPSTSRPPESGASAGEVR
jgi:hypothetical protein